MWAADIWFGVSVWRRGVIDAGMTLSLPHHHRPQSVWRRSGWTAALTVFAVLMPYRAWVTFASALNASVWWLHRQAPAPASPAPARRPAGAAPRRRRS
ncbi:hypothetical protein GCM10027610_109410 [Dactylosporangium cerinum]